MGSAMVRRLMGSGLSVQVWNRSQGRAQALLDEGAGWAATPAELARSCDTVITMLTDDAALESVYLGADGLLASVPPGALFIDMSTVPPATAQRIGQRVAAAGARFLECPVGGSVGPARDGKLLGFVGGEAVDLERARPVLTPLCRSIEHVGGLGAGATMKLAINLPLMVYWQTLAESLSIMQPLGLDPARVVDILADTSGGPNMLKARGPAIAQALAGSPGPVSVDVATMRKDMRAMLAEAAAHQRRLPLTELALRTFEQASSQGLDGADCTQLPVWWLGDAGRS